MFGWRGRLLRVNLTNGVITAEALDPAVARDYLGGRGLGAYLHTKEVSGSAAPLGSENHLVFTTGPLTGTLAPNGGRYTVVTRTAPSGALMSASISGKWGPELKFAGYDGIIFEGCSSKPVYLWVHDGKAELRSAVQAAGKRVSETTAILLEETDPSAVVCCVGPAGENKVGCSVIVSDGMSAAGKNGVGAVMGSKNLKAVVVRGTQGFRVADYPRFLESATELRSFMKARAIAARGTRGQDPVLTADSLAWNSAQPDSKAARTRGCFGCATSFSSFESEGHGFLPLPAGVPPSEMSERLKEYRAFVDLGLDFAGAKTVLGSLPGNGIDDLARKIASGAELGLVQKASPDQGVDRGPCMAAGYAIVPRIPAGGDLPAVLDSAGLCPFLSAGIGLDTIAELLTSATGVAFSQQDILQVAQRVNRTGNA